MLKTLTIENFALIENVTVEFGAGLNILTGETGAGKSILIEALGAIIGNRLGASKIRKGADFLRVKAVFLIENSFPARDIVELTIERKISRTGKNSVAVDGKPITLAQLRKYGAALLDMHDQNKNLEFLREKEVYRLIDTAEIYDALKVFAASYGELNSKKRSLAKKLSAREENLQRLEFLRWQAKEISAAKLKPDEDVKLDAEIRKLSHAEKIAENVQASAQILNDGDYDVLTALARVSKHLDAVARYDDKLNSARKLLEDAEIALREAYDEIRDYGDGLDFSPERLNELHARADEISRLKKYGASVNEILQRLEKIRVDIASVENFDSDVSELQAEVGELERQTKTCAEKLLALRQASANNLSAKIEREIQRLGMARAQFEIVVTAAEKLSENGGDKADILFCANVGEEKFSLSEVVSGGELSRIVLAIKIVLAAEQRGDYDRVMVFDEIDTGLGGVTAKTVAECISEISRGWQVLCITHLPQIASMADVHLQISKSEVGGRTLTKVTRLNEAERVNEIARMASGKESAVSIENAGEMLASAQRFKRAVRLA